MKTYGRKVRDVKGGAREPVKLRPVLLDTSSDNTLAGLASVVADGSKYSFVNPGTTGTMSSDIPHTRGKKSTTSSVLQTPFTTEGNDSGAFKLGTSRPLPVSPGHRFSPVPLAESSKAATLPFQVDGRAHIKRRFRRSRNGTTSHRLKENMRPKPPKHAHTFVLKTTKVSRPSLASPFASRPPSPAVQETAQNPTTELDHESRLAPRPLHRQSLSDTRINQGFDSNFSVPRAPLSNPHSAPETQPTPLNQGNKNIPAVSLVHIQRRPSAPSLRHRVLSGLASAASLNVNIPTEAREGDRNNTSLNRRANLGIDRLTSYEFLCGAGTYFVSSLDGAVDFNRPPSQMSLYGGHVDSDSSDGGLFKYIQGRSTPKFSTRSVPLRAPPSRLAERDFSGEPLLSRQNSAESAQLSEKNLYSPWISDSIISPPSYHKQHKDYDLSVMERTLEDMDLTLPASPSGAAATSANAPNRSTGATAENVLQENIRGPSLSPRRTRPLITELNMPMYNHKTIDTTVFDDPERNMSTQFQAVSGFSRTRSGTIVQSRINGGRIADRRTRSGTITQGGGGTRRTRSGTIVQANKESRHGPAGGPRHSQDAQDSHLSENDESQDRACSCRSSDDELMLRSHSHHDLDAEDLDWKVADPPSPVIKRLRRAERRNLLRRQRAKGKKRKSGTFSAVVEDEDYEDGIDGDIEDDELDFLGNFVPEDW